MEFLADPTVGRFQFSKEKMGNAREDGGESWERGRGGSRSELTGP